MLRPAPAVLIVALATFGGTLTAPAAAAGQQLLEQVRTLAGQNAEAYAEPITLGLAHALAAGYMDRASILPAFGFDVGFRFLGALPTREQKHFNAFVPDSVVFRDQVYHDPYRSADGTLETPTIAGEGPGVVLVPSGTFEAQLVAAGEDPQDYRILLPDGLSLPVVPAMSFHGSLGIGAGTQLTIHFLPRLEVVSEVGELSGHGFTVHHALSHWFTSPVDLMLTAGFQEARAGEFLETSALHYGGVGGVRAGPMSFFGGVLLRNASTDISYQVELPDGLAEDHPAIPAGAELSFTTSAGSGPAYLVGARLQLLALNLAGHYTFGTYDVFTLKLGLGLP